MGNARKTTIWIAAAAALCAAGVAIFTENSALFALAGLMAAMAAVAAVRKPLS